MVAIEIITHCWAGQLQQYAAMLRCQLGSLANHPPARCEVKISVCYSPRDEHTVSVIEHARRWQSPGWKINSVRMERGELFRRAIGRNRLSKESSADAIWLTDCDYLFGEGCLDSLAMQIGSLDPLSFPRRINIHRDHATGDDYLIRLGRFPGSHPPEIDKADFIRKLIPLAIGGVMILTPELASRGFCDGSKRYLKTIQVEKGWQRSHCDKYARLEWDVGRGTNIDIPELYRLRHSQISYSKLGIAASLD